MRLRPEQLSAHLAQGLAPLYVVHGDEPLLAIEAGDAIRAGLAVGARLGLMVRGTRSAGGRAWV